MTEAELKAIQTMVVESIAADACTRLINQINEFMDGYAGEVPHPLRLSFALLLRACAEQIDPEGKLDVEGLREAFLETKCWVDDQKARKNGSSGA